MENKSSIYMNFVGRPVKIKVCDGIEFEGIAIAMDTHFNISLESVLCREDGNGMLKQYPSVFIKGSYIDYVTLGVQDTA